MKNFLLATLVILCVVENDVKGALTKLEDVLLEDLIPDKGSNKCSNDGNSTIFSFDFHSFNKSHWASPNDERENLVFLASMSHIDNNYNRSWTVRIGHGGNIYSLIGAYGEAIPPQTLENSPWIDEVTQSVAVDIEQLDTQKNRYYFIHQAGTYQKDDLFMPPPFYSPNVAKSCFGNTCRFASWAQQAHVPTVFKSNLLCIHQYRDCGNGVLEYTQNLLNMGGKKTLGNNLRYLNVPWAGVRTSSLKDVLMSNKDGTMKEPEFPLQKFSDNLKIPNLADTGGYTTFAQNLPNPPGDYFVERPCADAQKQIWKMTCTDNDIANNNYVRLQIEVQANNTCKYLASASKNQGGYVVQLKWHDPEINFPFIPGCRLCDSDYGMKFINERTGKWIYVSDIVWWSRHGYTFFKSPNATDSEINQIFFDGDKIQIVYNEGPVLSFDDNLALSYIHGIDEEYDDVANQWMWLPTRIRYGVAGRDFTVFTVNARVELSPGKIYSNRQYLVSDRLSNIEQHAKSWVDETLSDMIYASDLHGRKLVVYSNGDGTIFGIGHASDKGGNTTSCANGVARCIGNTTPQNDLKAYFYITCGNSTYFGPNLYAFSPERDESGYPESTVEPIRSYVCKNQGVRPTWKLLGHFKNESGCFEMESSKYDNNFCTSPNPPSVSPSISPSTPSTEPISPPPNIFSKPISFQPSINPSYAHNLIKNETLTEGFKCTSNSQCQSNICSADNLNDTKVCSKPIAGPGLSSTTEHHVRYWMIGSVLINSLRLW